MVAQETERRPPHRRYAAASWHVLAGDTGRRDIRESIPSFARPDADADPVPSSLPGASMQRSRRSSLRRALLSVMVVAPLSAGPLHAQQTVPTRYVVLD